MIWYAMREAAMWRHMVVCTLWYPPGSERDDEMQKHVRLVKAVYGA